MSRDPYAPCLCGSGKKYKWCCQAIDGEIARAFRQDEEGQHETALRLMEEVAATNATNPQVWGRMAELLYTNGKVEEAEAALQKAFDLNPNYAFGYLLRGNFRYNEGELPGALLLLRKAAAAYDPEAHDSLAHVHALIFDCEMRLNRPVAARAALAIALHCQPAAEDLRRTFDAAFGPQSNLPQTARREYVFLHAATSEGSRRDAWDRALATVTTPRLKDAAQVFEQLTAEDAPDAAAWYNLGLARAWLGENRTALDALDCYVSLEADEQRAGAAWALGEVLRCGTGLEEEADYLEHLVEYQIRDPQPLVRTLGEWEQARRLIVTQAVQEQAAITAVVLETLPTLTVGTGITPTARLGAHLIIQGNWLRLFSPLKEGLEKVRADLQERTGPALALLGEKQEHALFRDILAEAVIYPLSPANADEAKRLIGEHAARFLEETWIHRPLRSLNHIPPVDAAGHAVLRRKLIGVIQFVEDCAADALGGYDFDRLRRKLGLSGAAPAPAVKAPVDVSSMGTAELSGLKVEDLSEEQLEQAYQAALKLDAQDMAGHFARAAVARPPQAGRPDRFPWYTFLVQRALAEGKTDEALDFVNEGERSDCEQNEGRRRNDWELRRGQVHAKRGEADQAYDVFERLLERMPSELKYRATATEAMLSLRQGQRALRLAEEGVKKARQQNNRDSEQHFLELVAAAKKHGG